MAIVAFIALGIVAACLAVMVLVLRTKFRRKALRLAQCLILNEDLGFYYLCYDIAQDTIELSPQCAKLLNLPLKIDRYSDRKRAEAQQPGQPLYPVAQSLVAQDRKQFYRHQQADGKQRRFQLYTRVFQDEFKRPSFIYGVFMDVTDQFHTETRLEAKARTDGWN